MSVREADGGIRVGLIGAGFMAKAHTLAFRNAPLFFGDDAPPRRLVRLADPAPGLAKRVAGIYGWEEATEDWRAVTRAEDIDLVDIASPNDAHLDAAHDALAHGKAVYCEKPLAESVQSARAMAADATDAGVVNAVNFVYRSWPAMRLARTLIEDGRLGAVRTFHGRFFHDYAFDPQLPATWRFRRERAGSGSIGDVGSHLIDLARFLVGEPTEVVADVTTRVHERPNPGDSRRDSRSVAVDVDDEAAALLRFSTGARGRIETSWAALGHKTVIEFDVIGDRGSLSFSWARPAELRFYDAADPEAERGFKAIVVGPDQVGVNALWPVAGQGLGWGDAFLLTAHRVARAVAGFEELVPTFRDGLKVQELLDAIDKSIRERTWARVE